MQQKPHVFDELITPSSAGSLQSYHSVAALQRTLSYFTADLPLSPRRAERNTAGEVCLPVWKRIHDFRWMNLSTTHHCGHFSWPVLTSKIHLRVSELVL